MINKHKSNKIKENSNTVRHLNNGTDHRHSKSCCDQSSPARRTIIIGSDSGLAPGRRQAIIWTNAEILLMGLLQTNFSEILIEIYTFSFKKCIWKCRLENGGHFVSVSLYQLISHAKCTYVKISGGGILQRASNASSRLLFTEKTLSYCY